MHWSTPYIGEPYIPVRQDCAAFVERVVRERFGRALQFPRERAHDAIGQAQQILDARDDFGELIRRPTEGCGVLMSSRGGSRWHVGVYCDINHAGWVLHAWVDAMQVCCHRIRDLDKYGLTLEGYYAWM